MIKHHVSSGNRNLNENDAARIGVLTLADVGVSLVFSRISMSLSRGKSICLEIGRGFHGWGVPSVHDHLHDFPVVVVCTCSICV